MSYKVKEIFYTLQGEGQNAGRPAVFCRFSGCNLWTGREQDRHKAVCQFCDTDFVGTDGVGGGKFDTPEALAAAVATRWPQGHAGRPLVVCTGGEPLLQLDETLIEAFHAQGFEALSRERGAAQRVVRARTIASADHHITVGDGVREIVELVVVDDQLLPSAPVPFALAKKALALRAVLRKNSYAAPWN